MSYSIQQKKLFTPGPLGCSASVKKAMLIDAGSRDPGFLKIVQSIRQEILNIAGLPEDDYTTVLLQGSGTYSVEAVIHSATPQKNGKVLILSNGAYGNRMRNICQIGEIPFDFLEFAEDEIISSEKVKEYLQNKPDCYTLVTVVHCETSSGALNPVEAIGQVVNTMQPNATYLVDAMSSFAGVPLDIVKGKIHFLVTSPNKCLQGVPGFSILIARKDKLMSCKGNSKSFSLDLVHQLEEMDRLFQFRFTPPTHALLAFRQALDEYYQEGGLQARSKRYKDNCRIIEDGMQKLGFRKLLNNNDGYIITSYYYPVHPLFDFNEFYRRLSDLGQLIYPGKVTKATCFRIGNIGELYPKDMEYLLKCIEKVLNDMNVTHFQ